MKRCAICQEEINGGMICHSSCLETLKATAETRRLPAGAWCSYDRTSRTLSLTVPQGIMTIVSTQRQKRRRVHLQF